MSNKEDYDLLKAADVAGILGVRPRTVLRWVREGALPCIHLGKVVRIKRTDLDRFLAGHRKEGRF